MTDIPNKNNNSFILNQIHATHITPPLKFKDGILESLPNLFVDKIQKNEWMSISKLWLSYQKSMYRTKIINKRNKCIMQEINWWIFWVMSILQNCAMSLIILLNWIKMLWKKVLIYLFCTVQELLNGKINILMNYNHMWNYHVIYYLNLLIIITLFYHLYIQYEIYNSEYNKNKGYLDDSLFIQGIMGKWDDYDTFLKIIRRRGNWIYIKLYQSKWLLIL